MTKEKLVKLIYKHFGGSSIDLRDLDFTPYKCDVYITNMKVDGDLYQMSQKVSGNLYQHLQDVGGNLSQGNQTVIRDMYAANNTVDGKTFYEPNVEYKKPRG